METELTRYASNAKGYVLDDVLNANNASLVMLMTCNVLRNT